MIVTDLDDTLLMMNAKFQHIHAQLSQVYKTRNLFIIATARSFPAAAVAIKDINPDWGIYNNGALAISKVSNRVAVPITATVANCLLTELVNDIKVKTIKVSAVQNEYASKIGLKKWYFL